MRIIALALDPRTAPQALTAVAERLPAKAEVVAVVSESIGHPQEHVLTRARATHYPSDRMDPLSRARRVLATNLISRKIWRAVSRHTKELALDQQDLIVACDELSIRAAWQLHRRHHIRAIARVSGLALAIRQFQQLEPPRQVQPAPKLESPPSPH